MFDPVAVLRHWTPTGLRRASLLLGLAGLAIVAGALASAIGFLAHEVASWRDLPAIALAGVIAAAGLTAVTAVAWTARTRPTIALVVAGVLYIVTAAATVLAIDGPLIEDARAYHRLAIGWTLGAPPIADRPMGWPILLGEAYRVAGVSPSVGEVVNLVIRTACVACLAVWVGLSGGRRAAAVAVTVLAVSPVQALYAVTLMSETLYTTLLTVTVLFLTLLLRSLQRGVIDHGTALLAIATGVVLGLSAYVRTTSLAAAPFIALAPMIWQGPRRAAFVTLAVVVSFAVILTPAVIANKVYLDRWSPSTSLFTGWQFFVGANVEAGGRWTDADASLVNARAPDASISIPRRYARGDFDPAALRLFAQRDDIASQMAIERIGRDAFRLPLILPFKFVYGWGPGDPWAADPKDSERVFDVVPEGFGGGGLLGGQTIGGTVQHTASYAAQVWWIAVLVGALAWFVRQWRNEPITAVAVSVVLVPLTVGLLLLQSSARYHEYAVPIIAGLAAVTLTTWRQKGGPDASDA